ncbi:MAG: GNAT family N-acetyltransferase [Cytophagales bacterium]|nr:GNAT family N-acetyltransferase [Cytophagales bacterium]
MITIKKISTAQELSVALQIRNLVFSKEISSYPAEKEDLDLISEQFLAYDENSKACGAARWRFGEGEIVLERCAVLKEYRTKGVGTSLVQAIIKDIQANPNTQGLKISLCCQPSSIFLYQKFGFAKSGSPFIQDGEIQIPMTMI